MKKKLTTTLALLICAVVLLSQNLPFPENGAVWKESHTTIAGPIERHFALCGDTTILGNSYSKVLDLQVDSALNVVGETYLGAIRSEGEAVLYQPNSQSPEYVLFDFSLETGDSIDLLQLYSQQPQTRYVDSTATQLLAGEMRKLIYFAPGYPGAPVEFWIEGIGSSYGLLGRAFDPGADIGFNLLCFGHGNEYFTLSLIECFLPELGNCGITSSTDETTAAAFSIFPNPATEMVRLARLNGGSYSWRIDLLDLDGRIKKSFYTEGSGDPTLDISDQNTGVYFLKIWNKKTGEAIGISKIVVLRK